MESNPNHRMFQHAKHQNGHSPRILNVHCLKIVALRDDCMRTELIKVNTNNHNLD